MQIPNDCAIRINNELARFPLELVWPVDGIGSILETGMANGASGITAASVPFTSCKFRSRAATARCIVTNATVTHGHGFSLILHKLVIIRGLVGRRHGMGAAVTGRAKKSAMPDSITVERCSGIHLGNTGIVASHTLGFTHPWDSGAKGNSGCNRGQSAMTVDAIAVRGGVMITPVALGDCSRMTVVATRRGRQGGVKAMYGLGKVLARSSRPRLTKGRATVAFGTEYRFRGKQRSVA